MLPLGGRQMWGETPDEAEAREAREQAREREQKPTDPSEVRDSA
jgi:hypothetical protein